MPASGPIARRPARGAWPSRRTFALLAGALGLFAVYLSLIPFRVQPIPLQEALARFAQAMTGQSMRAPRADVAANSAFFLVLGGTLAGALSLDGSRRRRFGACLLSGLVVAVLTLGLEFAETFFPGRVVSRSDVLAGTMGAWLGAAAWAAAGQPAIEWLRHRVAGGREGDWVIKLCTLYVVGYAIAALLPFDITVDLGELAAKVREGKIRLLPGIADGALAWLWSLGWSALATAPIGVLTSLGPTRRGAGLVPAVGAGVAVVVLLEGAQVFLVSRSAEGSDVLAGAIGVVAGIQVADILRRTQGALRRRRIRQGLVGWALAVAAYHWYPFTVDLHPAFIEARLAGLSWTPLTSYHQSEPFVAVEQFLTKGVLGAPLGILCARVIPPGGARRLVRIGAAALVYFSLVEAGQILLASRVPDVGDALIGVAGVVGGLLVCDRLTSRSSPPVATGQAGIPA